MSRFTLSVLFLAAACTNPIQLDEGSYERRAESTPEAFGVLALLNDANTTLDILDDNAALDSRAARSLIAHRNGPDRTYLTADDNRFDSMAEVDDQYYVGINYPISTGTRRIHASWLTMEMSTGDASTGASNQLIKNWKKDAEDLDAWISENL